MAEISIPADIKKWIDWLRRAPDALECRLKEHLYANGQWNYYNKKFLPVSFDSINADIIRYKSRDDDLSIIETKHSYELMTGAQGRVFPKLCNIFKSTCKHHDVCPGYEPIDMKLHIFVLRGEAPQNEEERQRMLVVDEKNIILEDLITGKQWQISLREYDALMIGDAKWPSAS